VRRESIRWTRCARNDADLSTSGGCAGRFHARINPTADAEDDVKLNTYVNFAGKCAEAFRFYEKHLGGTIGMMMTHGQAPDPSRVDPAWKDAVLHARISLAGTDLQGADIPNAQPMRSAYLTLSVDSDAEAERIFSALADGGEVLDDPSRAADAAGYLVAGRRAGLFRPLRLPRRRDAA
jgi:PhnB protein